ncbi:MAG TPA: hypothetical protein VMW45_04590 [Dehalococcoidia bacterium]|nr:hypothetical protein [Dehalococcoidia bacterium]
MLTVTEDAKQILKEKLLAHTEDPELVLRLKGEPGGQLGLVLDKQAPDDYVVEHEEAKVLLIGKELADVVDELTLTTEDTPEGPKLTISRE